MLLHLKLSSLSQRGDSCDFVKESMQRCSEEEGRVQTMPRQWPRPRGRPYNTLGSVDLEYVIAITCIKCDLEEILRHCLSSGEGGAKGERAARYKNIIPRGREGIVESNQSVFFKSNQIQLPSNLKHFNHFREEGKNNVSDFQDAFRSSQPKMT